MHIAIVSTNTKCFESMHAQCNYINIIIMIITVYIYIYIIYIYILYIYIYIYILLCVHMDFKMSQV